MKSVVHEMDLNKNNQEHFPEYQRVNLQTSCKQSNKNILLTYMVGSPLLAEIQQHLHP